MPHRKWRGVLDLLDETDRILVGLNQIASEAMDPSTVQRLKRHAANARTTLQAAITALSRANDLPNGDDR